MAKLSEEALTYVPPVTKNISELEEVQVDVEVTAKTIGEGDAAFSYKSIVVDGTEYRVGASVLKQLKVHLQNNPKLKKFKVNREGEGMKTVYTVIPL